MKGKVLAYLLTAASIQIGCLLIRRLLRGMDYAHFRRIHDLINLELGMVVGDFYIYRRIMQALFPAVPRHGPHHPHHHEAGAAVVDAVTPRTFVEGALILYFILCHCTFLLFYYMVSDEPKWLALLCFLCFGVYVHLFILLLTFTAIEIVSERFLSSVLHARRTLVKPLLLSRKLHTVASVVLALALVIFGVSVTNQPPIVRRQPVYLRNLPADFEGFKVVLLTDMHIGPTVGRKRVEEIVRIVNLLKPDVIAMAGDIVDGSTKHLLVATEPMKHFEAKHGVFFASGNHEYYHGNVDDWMATFERDYDIRALHNSHQKIRAIAGGDYLCLAGVDDVYSERSGVPHHAMNLSAALSGGCGRNGGAAATILLSHQPNAAKKMLDGNLGGNLDLVLCGHTHGGQLYVFLPAAYLGNSYLNGLYRHKNGAQVYVSPGVNYWGPPIKMYRLREISLLELRRK